MSTWKTVGSILFFFFFVAPKHRVWPKGLSKSKQHPGWERNQFNKVSVAGDLEKGEEGVQRRKK